MSVFSGINKLREFGSKFIKISSPGTDSVSGLLHSGRWQGTGGRTQGRRRSGPPVDQ